MSVQQQQQDLQLQQKLLQRLSPQQILLMKLIQFPVMALEQRVKEELEINPALDISDDNSEEQEDKTEDFDDTEQVQEQEQEQDGKNDENERDSENEMETDNEFSLEDYLDEDEIPDYRLYSNNNRSDENVKEIPMVSSKSFHELLLEQLRMSNLNETDYQIALQIIGNIDDSGYLSREPETIADDLLFTKNINVSEKHVTKVLHVIQEFDPVGIAARNLQECLLLQLKRKTPTPAIQDAIAVLDNYFDEFSKKHYDRIMKRMEMPEEQLKNVIAEVLKLNPKPGDFSTDIYVANQSIIPDFVLTVTGDKIDIQLNNSNIPELHISREYQNLLEHYSKNNTKSNSQNKEAVQFVRSRIEAARWFIDAIRQRKNTLLEVMNAIADAQKEFFLTGDEKYLKPMILNDISKKINMDASTISRVANSKYVQTPFETILLKKLFSESFQNDDGDEISTKEIKQALKKMIDEEDKSAPLQDDKLLELLKQKGYTIARRTVAKYREHLNIAPARLRREL